MNEIDAIALNKAMQTIVEEFRLQKAKYDSDGTSVPFYNCEKMITRANSIVRNAAGDLCTIPREDRNILISLPRGLSETGLIVEANSSLDKALADLKKICLMHLRS